MSDKIHEIALAPSGIYNTMGLDLVLFVFWCKIIVTNAPSDENLNLASYPVDEKPFSSGVCTVSKPPVVPLVIRTRFMNLLPLFPDTKECNNPAERCICTT
jgi:hypothetical protein